MDYFYFIHDCRTNERTKWGRVWLRAAKSLDTILAPLRQLVNSIYLHVFLCSAKNDMQWIYNHKAEAERKQNAEREWERESDIGYIQNAFDATYDQHEQISH